MKSCFRSIWGILRVTTAVLLLPALVGFGTVARAAEPTNGTNYMGINASPIVDYTTVVTADVVKQSRCFGTSSNAQDTSVPKDANGWPSTDFQLFCWNGTASNMDGTYAISFPGSATIGVSFTSGLNASISNQVYNAGANSTTASMTITGTTGSSALYLSFLNTRRIASDTTATGLANLKIMRPVSPGSSTSYLTTDVYYNDTINLCKKFQAIRFMDFTATNGNGSVNWADRTNAAMPSQYQDGGTAYGWEGKGASYEMAVRLANDTNCDMWINVPHMATADFMTKMAQVVYYGSDGRNPYTSAQANPVWAPLKSTLKCYFEFSNEVWNWGFGQAVDNNTIANNAVAANHSSIYNYNGKLDGYYWQRRVAEQSVIMSQAVRAVVGDSNMMTRFRPVLEWQYGNAQESASRELQMMDEYYNNQLGNFVATPHPVSYYFWGGGSAAYYGPVNSDSDTLTSSQILSESDVTVRPAQWDYNKADVGFTAAYGIKRAAYEGGEGLGDVAEAHSAAAKDQALSNAGMINVEVHNQDFWSREGGDLLMYFEANDDLGYGFYRDGGLNSYKLQGITQLGPLARATQTLFPTAPCTIDGAGWMAQAFGNTNGLTGTWNLNSADWNAGWYGWDFNVTTPGTYTVTVSVASGQTGTLKGTIDSGGFSTMTYPGGGGNSSTLSATLGVGYHGVRLVASTGSVLINSVSIASSGGSAPAAPTGLSASAGNTQVSLAWNASSGATSYNVYRGTSAGAESGTPIVTGVSTTSFTNTGLTNGTTYYYKVKAANSVGASGYSNEASAMPAASGGGSNIAPTGTGYYWHGNASATAATNQVAITGVNDNNTATDFSLNNNADETGAAYEGAGVVWTAAQNNIASVKWINGTYDAGQNGVFTANFQLQTSTDGTTWTASSWTASPAYAYDTSAAGGATYTFSGTAVSGIKGVRIVGQVRTGASNSWHATGRELQVMTGTGGAAPAAPTGLTATAGNAQVALSWTASSGATSYNVKRSTTSGSGYVTVTSPTTTTYTNTGLTNGTTYYFVVTAVNASGESANSAQVSATPTAGTGATVTFESKAAGTYTGTYTEGGYNFVVSDGGYSVYDTTNGFASHVFQADNWGTTVTVTKVGGGTFNLASFNYASDIYSGTGSANLTGVKAGGNYTGSITWTASKTQVVKALSWTGVTSVTIQYTGDYCALDQFIFN